jgi:hypothetical protein
MIEAFNEAYLELTTTDNSSPFLDLLRLGQELNMPKGWMAALLLSLLADIAAAGFRFWWEWRVCVSCIS